MSYCGSTMVIAFDARTADLKEIAKRINAGEVFIYPTDTVYGIGCDALNEKAVERVYEAKGRDFKKPMSVAFSDIMQLKKYVSVDEKQLEMIKQKLPGAYTFIVKNKAIPKRVAAGLDTIGIRIPDHSRMLALIREANTPIVTTSANLAGGKPASSVHELSSEMLARVDFVIDGGKCGSGKPSTILDLATGEKLR